MLLNGTFLLSAYYASWSIYGRNFEVKDLPFSDLTHVNYAFAGVYPNGTVHLTDLWADIERPIVTQSHGQYSDPESVLMGNLGAIYEHKQANRHLKVGLSVGGWGGSAGFSSAVGTDISRKEFVTSGLKLLNDLGLDFLDFDWEYPVSGGQGPHSADDGRNYVLFLQELQSSIANLVNSGGWNGRTRPEVTVALPCGEFMGRFDYLKEMAEVVDFANLMCYDFTSAQSSMADHHSNLFSRHPGMVSVDVGVKELLAAGFPARKTVLGIPIYARGFSGCSSLADSFVGVPSGTWGDPGVLDYNVLPLRNGTCEPMLESITNATFCHDTEANDLLVYDSVTAVEAKVAYIKSHNLAGAMFWEPSADVYFDSRDRLIGAAHSAFLPAKLDNSENNICYLTSPYINVKSRTNCSYKSGQRCAFIPKDLSPVDRLRVQRAKPFGARIHHK